jgi:hypothetical protein
MEFGCCDVTSFNGSNTSFAARSEMEQEPSSYNSNIQNKHCKQALNFQQYRCNFTSPFLKVIGTKNPQNYFF